MFNSPEEKERSMDKLKKFFVDVLNVKKLVVSVLKRAGETMLRAGFRLENGKITNIRITLSLEIGSENEEVEIHGDPRKWTMPRNVKR